MHNVRRHLPRRQRTRADDHGECDEAGGDRKPETDGGDGGGGGPADRGERFGEGGDARGDLAAAELAALACARNQSWMAVAQPAAITMPLPVIAACQGDAMAMTATSGAKTTAMIAITASILARST